MAILNTIAATKKLLIRQYPVGSFHTNSQRANAMTEGVKNWKVCGDIQLTPFQLKAINHYIDIHVRRNRETIVDICNDCYCPK